jgi:CPA2 family monovalent cation:H+ antiporter-2
MVRAKSRLDAYELFDMGIDDVYRESLDTSVRLGVDVLCKLGFRKYAATRAGPKFIRYDEAALRTLAAHRHDQASYIFNTREQIELQEQLLTIDRETVHNVHDDAWDSEKREE